jgi:6-phosphogluconolactonase
MDKELPFILFLLFIVMVILSSRKEKQFVVSSYSSKEASDVRLMNFLHRKPPRQVSELSVWNNPSYFTIGERRTLYFANEVASFNGEKGGGITTVRSTRKNLEPVIGNAVNQGGGGPCYIMMSADRQYLLTANYGSGSVSVIRVNSSGLPGDVTDTVFFPHPDSLLSHPHMVYYNPAKDVYYITDLGLDKVYIFNLNSETGKLIPAEVPFLSIKRGSGPRHMVMDHEFVMLYIINELNSTISVFNMSDDQPVLEQTISALPQGYVGENASGDICLSHSGSFLYVTNRGNNTIGVFRVRKGGRLELEGHVSCGGNWPRNLTLDKHGKHMIVCNQRSGDLAFFRVNRRTGMPEKEDYSYKLTAPSCVKFIE